MNSRPDTPWLRLAAAARRATPAAASATEHDAAPHGFATRVVALAGVRPGGGSSGLGFERLAARALGLASACALAMVIWAGVLGGAGEARAAASTDSDLIDPVGVILEAAHSS